MPCNCTCNGLFSAEEPCATCTCYRGSTGNCSVPLSPGAYILQGCNCQCEFCLGLFRDHPCPQCGCEVGSNVVCKLNVVERFATTLKGIIEQWGPDHPYHGVLGDFDSIVQNLAQEQNRPKKAIGFLGATGAGKSFLMTALLCHDMSKEDMIAICQSPGLLKSNEETANSCTAYGTEVHHHREYAAKIGYIGKTDWEELRKQAADNYCFPRSTRQTLGGRTEPDEGDIGPEDEPVVDDDDAANPEHNYNLYCEVLDLVYGDGTAYSCPCAIVNALRTDEFREDDEVPHVREFLAHRNSLEQRSFSCVQELVEFMNGEIHTRHPSFGLFVEVVRLYGPFRVLAGGITLIDMPGSGDTSHLRTRVFDNFRRICKHVVLVSKFNTNDEAAWGMHALLDRLRADDVLGRTLVVTTQIAQAVRADIIRQVMRTPNPNETFLRDHIRPRSFVLEQSNQTPIAVDALAYREMETEEEQYYLQNRTVFPYGDTYSTGVPQLAQWILNTATEDEAGQDIVEVLNGHIHRIRTLFACDIVPFEQQRVELTQLIADCFLSKAQRLEQVVEEVLLKIVTCLSDRRIEQTSYQLAYSLLSHAGWEIDRVSGSRNYHPLLGNLLYAERTVTEALNEFPEAVNHVWNHLLEEVQSIVNEFRTQHDQEPTDISSVSAVPGNLMDGSNNMRHDFRQQIANSLIPGNAVLPFYRGAPRRGSDWRKYGEPMCRALHNYFDRFFRGRLEFFDEAGFERLRRNLRDELARHVETVMTDAEGFASRVATVVMLGRGVADIAEEDLNDEAQEAIHMLMTAIDVQVSFRSTAVPTLGNCPMCQARLRLFQTGRQAVVSLPCHSEHRMHAECVADYRRNAGRHVPCPICRTMIDLDQAT